MFRSILLLAALCLSAPALADVPKFPASFHAREVAANGVNLHVRVGGKGPAILLLHGYGETGDMWAPLAAALENTPTVIVPDLRGLGPSSHPARGSGKKTQVRGIQALLAPLGVQRSDLVAHRLRHIGALALATPPPAVPSPHPSPVP